MLPREDRRFLTGQGRHLDDMAFHGALHVHFVRSPQAHARLLGIDVRTDLINGRRRAVARHAGVEPADCRNIALRSSVHCRADFVAIAEQLIVAIAPGPVLADPVVLNCRHLRPESGGRRAA